MATIRAGKFRGSAMTVPWLGSFASPDGEQWAGDKDGGVRAKEDPYGEHKGEIIEN